MNCITGKISIAEIEFGDLNEVALHQGFKLLRSRKRQLGGSDYGKFALTDNNDTKLLGFGTYGCTATASGVQAYIRSGITWIWQQ